MKEFKYVITDELGIHARPAGLFVKEAAKFQSDIKIKKGEKEAGDRGYIWQIFFRMHLKRQRILQIRL